MTTCPKHPTQVLKPLFFSKVCDLCNPPPGGVVVPPARVEDLGLPQLRGQWGLYYTTAILIDPFLSVSTSYAVTSNCQVLKSGKEIFSFTSAKGNPSVRTMMKLLAEVNAGLWDGHQWPTASAPSTVWTIDDLESMGMEFTYEVTSDAFETDAGARWFWYTLQHCYERSWRT